MIGVKHSKIGVALAVLRAIPMAAKDVIISTYSNCREQGFYLISYHSNMRDINYDDKRAVSFAENRNSDHIIVQYGIQKDFNDYGVINEAKYNSCKKYFKCGDAKSAGEFVGKWLKDLI